MLIPLLTFILGIFEYSRYMMVRGLADNACREGARFAVVHTYDKVTSDVQAQVTTMLAGQGGNLSGLAITVYKASPTTGANVGVWTDAKFGDTIAVTITGTYTPCVPGLLRMSSTIPVSTTSAMLSEAN